jgi:HNH endonuclease/AP2 domain
MITHTRLLEVLHYDEHSGVFTWRVRTSQRARIGEEAGTITNHGYRVLTIDSKRYLAHLVAWFYCHETWPTTLVDHRDNNKSNNALSNLRLANKHLNAANSRGHKDSKTGVKGVTFDARYGKYRATIGVNGRQHWLGYHETIKQAADAYSDAAQRHYGNFARTE